MTLELDSHYQNLIAKGRSSSISAPGFSNMEQAAIQQAAAAGRRQYQQQHQSQQQNLNGRNNYSQEGGERERSSQHQASPQHHQSSSSQYVTRGSGGNMQIIASNTVSTPTRSRKHGAGAHRSQSARVPGSQRPKVKRREQELQEYQQHLDLASSDGALSSSRSGGIGGDCEDSYNPFLNKVPSTGRLVTSTSLEMSQNSLHHQGTPPPQQIPLSHLQQINAAFLLDAPRESPHLRRRHSGGGYERRGSTDQKAMTDHGGGGGGYPIIIPTIATPEASPLQGRRGGGHNNMNQQQQQQQQQGNNKPAGLPRSPTSSRQGSQRRVNSMKSPKRVPERYLDVPGDNGGQQQSQQQQQQQQQNSGGSPEDDEDEESYRLRSFSLTPKGIVNRGDSFRRRRSRSNSLIPTPTTPEQQSGSNGNGNCNTFTSEDGLLMPSNFNSSRASSRNNSRRSSRASPNQTPNQSPRPSIAPQPPSPTGPATHYRVAMIGGRGVGKNALISQFLTSDSINAYDDGQDEVEGEKTVSVMLNGEESEMTFFRMNDTKTELNRLSPPDGFLLVYSVVDRASFQRVEAEIRRLQEMDLLRTKAVVIVANKIDLARSRSISTQDGRCLAVANRIKFIEISVGINHNVDELLVGILHQIRLKIELCGTGDHWCKHRGMLKASAKARQMLTWLLGKEDAKFKNCENLHII